MTILNIVQMVIAFLVILLVTLQVKKDASGLAGLMGNSTNNNKNVSSKLDKPTKYMLALVLAYIFISFGVSYQQSVAAQSVVTEKRIESSKSKE